MYDLEDLTTLDDQQKSAIRRAGLIDASELLLPPASELQKKLHLPNLAETHALIKAVSLGVVPHSATVAELVGKGDGDRWIGTGDEDIDRLLGGGIRRGVVTEVVGESAAGKSHLALLLSLTTLLAPFSPSPGGTILLTSERKISFSRPQELASHTLTLARSLPSSSTAPPLPASEKEMLDNVHTTHVTEVEGLDHALAYIIPAIMAKLATPAQPARGGGTPPLPVRLLIIDSIGALFRASFSSNTSGLTLRSRMLCLISDKLKSLAETHDIAVVVINQVTDVFTRDDGGSRFSNSGEGKEKEGQPQASMIYKTQSRFFSGQSDSLGKEASLGLVWANAVNVRIMLSRTGRRRALDHSDLARKRKRLGAYEKEIQGEESGGEEWESTLIRRMHLVFSPFAKEDTLDYVILPTGLQAIPSQSQKPAEPAGETNGGEGGEDEYAGDDLLDDLGELPAEYWNGEAFREERGKAVERGLEAEKEREKELEREREREFREAAMVDEDEGEEGVNAAELEDLGPEEIELPGAEAAPPAHQPNVE